MVMYIAIIFNELCFLCEFKNLKILIARYENVHKFWVCVDLEALRGPSCYFMFSTSLEVKTWFDYSRNKIMFIKKQPRIYSLNKLLASIKAHC
jgi:hypothetical protein